MKKNILGVKIDDISVDQAVDLVEQWLEKDGKSFGKGHSAEFSRSPQDKHYIVTPNPEFIVAAQKDPVFKKILNNADLSIPDGVGLKLSGRVKNTFAGTDFMEKLVALAAKKGFVTGFLGAGSGVAEKTSECLRSLYPKLKVTFAESGGEVDEEGNSIEYEVSSIEGKKTNSHYTLYPILDTDILFVAFGHIKQEKWIVKNLSKLPIKVAMGVGGAFDVISGQVPRAPIWIRNFGFEWLFRLCLQPWRIKRQLALIRYLYLLLRG